MSGRNPCNSGRYGDSGSPGIRPDGIRASLGDSGSPLDPSCKRGRFAPPGRRARGWTPFECRNLGFPDPRPNRICASAGVSGVLPRAELVQVWAGHSRSPDLSGRTAEFGARRSSSGRNSCMGHSRSCDTGRERAGVQKYPLSVRTGKGAPSECGRFGALGSIRTIFVQVWEVRGPPWCNRTKSVRGSLVPSDGRRPSAGNMGFPGPSGRNSCKCGSFGVPRFVRTKFVHAWESRGPPAQQVGSVLVSSKLRVPPFCLAGHHPSP